MNEYAPPSVKNKLFYNCRNATQNRECDLDGPFSMSELCQSLKNFHNSSPGLDCFTYKMLHKLPVCAKELLLGIFNDFQTRGTGLNSLKKEVIVLILKTGQDSSSSTSYRPISLMSWNVKTFEKMIKLRLDFFWNWSRNCPETNLLSERG